jgi:ABC-type uncharacterized transport system ATPase subunit
MPMVRAAVGTAPGRQSEAVLQHGTPDGLSHRRAPLGRGSCRRPGVTIDAIRTGTPAASTLLPGGRGPPANRGRVQVKAATLATRLQSYIASAERACALLDSPADVPERYSARPLRRATGRIAFEHVSFAYGAEGVLDDLSFDIAAGTAVGIVGRTGAGKTTMMNLLARFYDPTRGKILLDRVDLRDYRVADLRRQFALVLQEPVLFSTTIGEDIAYARSDATRDEIVAAAKAANAHEFISHLPRATIRRLGRVSECAASAAATAWSSGWRPYLWLHMWPRSPLLGCQRDQAGLLDPAASASPELCAELHNRMPVVLGLLAGERTGRQRQEQ